LFHAASPLSIAQLYAELDGRRYLGGGIEADGSFEAKISGSFSVAVLCCRPERTPSTTLWLGTQDGCGFFNTGGRHARSRQVAQTSVFEVCGLFTMNQKKAADLQLVATVSAFLTVGFCRRERPTVNHRTIDRGYPLAAATGS